MYKSSEKLTFVWPQPFSPMTQDGSAYSVTAAELLQPAGQNTKRK